MASSIARELQDAGLIGQRKPMRRSRSRCVRRIRDVVHLVAAGPKSGPQPPDLMEMIHEDAQTQKLKEIERMQTLMRLIHQGAIRCK